MTIMEFFGCGLIAFGPALSLFICTIAKDPLRVIVLIASAFFWLLALLLSSLLWFAVVPLRESIAFGLVFSVIFQEVFRLLFYLLLRKADAGLKKVSEREGLPGTLMLVNNKPLMAYVCGFGFGIISGAFSLVNVLADMTGPGTVGINDDHDMFFVVSAFFALCFIFLHIFWGVIFYDGLDHWPTNKWRLAQPIMVLVSHMVVSCLTLLNQGSNPFYLASIIPAYCVMFCAGIWAFKIAGGSSRSFKAFLLHKVDGYNLS